MYPNELFRRMRDLLNNVDLEDAHEFATAYAEHVDNCRVMSAQPLNVVDAIRRWVQIQAI